MIDAEAEVFDRVARAVGARWPEAFVSSDPTLAPTAFPAVYLAQADSAEYRKAHDSGGEKAAAVSFEADCYSDARPGGRAQAKELMELVCDEMASMNLLRSSCRAVPNLADPTVHRYHARFTGVVSRRGYFHTR